MINSNLRLVVSIAKQLPGPRPVAARPDPGGDHRADPRGREVRLAARASSSRPTRPGGSARPCSAASRTRRGRSGCRCTSSSASRRSRVRSASSRRSSGGRRPSEELAKAAKLPVKQVREVRQAARAVTSLDKPIGEDDEARVRRPDRGRRRPAGGGGARFARAGDAAPGRRRASRARAGGAAAPLRAQRRHRPGVARGDRTRLGITRERVRQIEAEALSGSPCSARSKPCAPPSCRTRAGWFW